MPEQILSIEQLLQDYVRERDAIVERSAGRQTLKPDRLLAAVRGTKRLETPAASRVLTIGKSHWIPNVEVFINREHCLVIDAELAGMRRQDLEITIDGNRLMISGQRPEIDPSGSKCSFLVTDINYGPFECVIEIPAGYELSRAKAAYKNGFLRVEVPKAQPTSRSLLSGFDVEKVLRDYVEDRDRVAAKAVLKPEFPRLSRPESALQRSVPRRWWEAVRQSFLSMIRREPKEPPASIHFPSAKEFRMPESPEAMMELLNAYYPPLYAYLRRTGYERARAVELLEKFVAHLLDRNLLAQVRPERGNFNCFLLSAMKHFMQSQCEQEQPLAATQRTRLEVAERRSRPHHGEIASAEGAFEREWALISNKARERLKQEYAAAGKSELFENLKDFLANECDAGYSPLARKFGMQPGAVAVLVSRMRSRFRSLIRDEIAHGFERRRDRG